MKCNISDTCIFLGWEVKTFFLIESSPSGPVGSSGLCGEKWNKWEQLTRCSPLKEQTPTQPLCRTVDLNKGFYFSFWIDVMFHSPLALIDYCLLSQRSFNGGEGLQMCMVEEL